MTPPRPDLADALARVSAALAAGPWGVPPPGFEALTPARPMRAVYAGVLDGQRVVLKAQRPVTAWDRVKRLVRGSGPARERRVLERLAAAGLPVPEALAHVEGAVDVLATRRVEGLEPLPHPRAASPALVVAVARLLARLFVAGLEHRDLTRANVGVVAGEPVLVDVGGARLLRAPRPARSALAQLAQAAHGFLHGASRAQAARGLRAWLEAAGSGRHAWRAWIRDVETARRERLRLHHRRRERRIARRGTRFALLAAPGLVGVRRVPETDAALDTWLAACLAGGPAGATQLKGPRVLAVRGPDGGARVLKRYAAAAPGRGPRALRAFRRAVALEERGLPTARALAAGWAPGGEGVLVSELVDAPDLDLVLRRDRRFERWPRARQRALLAALGRSVRALHEAEVTHRDLKAPNLLVAEEGTGFTLPIVDVDGARPTFAPVPWARRARDLARLAASLPLSASDRLRVLDAYAAVPPRPPLSRRDLAERVHAHAEAHRRRLAGRAAGSPPTPEPPAPGARGHG